MRVLHELQWGAVGLACLGLLIPGAALQAAPPDQPPPAAVQTSAVAVQDIALGPGGVFRGQVIDQTGNGKAGASVIVRRDEAQIAATTTDLNGRFALSGQRGGVVLVDAADMTSVYRLWAPNTAPPAARDSALILDQQTLRGQSPITSLLCNPLVILGAVATAVAVPLAIHYFNEKKSGS